MYIDMYDGCERAGPAPPTPRMGWSTGWTSGRAQSWIASASFQETPAFLIVCVPCVKVACL